MSRAPLIATSVLIGAAVGAAAVSFVPSVRVSELEARVSDLEQELADARRDASDWERVAAAERERKRVVEEEVASLRIAVENLPPPQPEDAGEGGHRGMGGAQEAGPRPRLAPKDWDGTTLRNELQRLAMFGRRMARMPLLDACTEAARAQGDDALDMLLSVLRQPGHTANLRLAATMVLEKLADERAVPVLLEALPGTDDWAQRRAMLRALANLPGEAQTPTFVDIWHDEESDQRLRMVAINALARRAHPTAIAVAEGTEAVADPALRARAVDSLHGHVREDSYRKTELIPTFGKALTTAAGEGQIRVALLALEGYWRPECVPYLRALEHAENVSAELTSRGKRDADAIEAGEQRPEEAGVPRTDAGPPDDEE